MTNFDYIKEMSLDDLAIYLCNIANPNGCDICPAAMYCYRGHNGFPDYLKAEVQEEEENE